MAKVATKAKAASVAPSTIGLAKIGGKDDGSSPLKPLDVKSPRKSGNKSEFGKGKNPNSLANLKPWQPGQVANPGGRPKGAKTRLEADFMWALSDAFHEQGKAAIDAVIRDKPHEFLKICAQLMPKDINVTTTMLDEMTLEQLEESLETLKLMNAVDQDVTDVVPK